MPGRRFGTWVLSLLLCGPTVACTPWTVRPIEEASRDRSQAARRFDPAAYVASIWASKVLPAANASAGELGSLTDADAANSGRARKSVFVKGTARVTDVDVRSRVGLAYLDLRGPGPHSRVALQVGPVLRGTTLRDALPFVRFTDFVNQIDFAAISSALNQHVLRSVLGTIDPASLRGKTIAFQGAAAVGGSSDVLEVVPVTLRVEGVKP